MNKPWSYITVRNDAGDEREVDVTHVFQKERPPNVNTVADGLEFLQQFAPEGYRVVELCQGFDRFIFERRQ